ncbi:MAG: hypothetical protein IPH31_23125 [Lewinellaceae bacterium]|nr:hypothetical protein [Lewinellaceae bacterium]
MPKSAGNPDDFGLHPLMPVADTVIICGPGVAVGVMVEGGVEPYSYQWNTGGTDPTISPFVTSPTTHIQSQ